MKDIVLSIKPSIEEFMKQGVRELQFYREGEEDED